MKKGTKIEICWQDAQEQKDWIMYEDHDFTQTPPLIMTVGYFMHEDDIQIIVAQSLETTVWTSRRGNMDALLQIPKCSIKSVIVV